MNQPFHASLLQHPARTAPKGVRVPLLALFLFLFLLLAHAPASPAADTNSSPEPLSARFNFEAFRLIAERNIFNPHRSSRGDQTPSAPREPDRRTRTETFSLLGTMSYEKGRFAFFDGSNSEYRKVLRAADSIGGFKIAAVAPACVRLENTNGQAIELCVGMQMAKHEEAGWQLREAAGSSANSGEASPSGDAGSDEVVKRLLQRREQDGGLTSETPPSPAPAPAAAQPAPSNAETDDVVKRLLQKREQELNK